MTKSEYNKVLRARKRAEDPDYDRKYNERQRAYYRNYMSCPETYIKRKINKLKASAKSRGLDFDLQTQDIVIPDFCPVTLRPFDWEVKMGPDRPSVDRIDTSKGYVKGNVRVISQKANACKSDLTIEEVERLLAYMKGEI